MKTCMCNAGFWILPGSEECSTCDAGKYSLMGTTTCIDCVAGKYQDTIAADTCKPCSVGNYSNNASASSCVDCPANSLHTTDRRTCRCNAGFRAVPGSEECSQCETGKYSVEGFSESALQKWRSYGMHTWKLAAAGQTCAQKCSSTVGMHCMSDITQIININSVTEDDFLKIFSILGVECENFQLLQDAPGWEFYHGRICYMPTNSYTTVVDCNQLTDNIRRSLCACAIDDTYMDVVTASHMTYNEATTCIDCVAGKYQDAPGADTCKPCSAGYNIAYEGAAACVRVCDADKYVIGDSCESCPEHSSSQMYVTGPQSCQCWSGYARTADGECAVCTAGKYQNLSLNDACRDCVAGTYSGATRSAACTPCPVRADSPTGSASCRCDAGASGPDNGLCLPCVAGKYKTSAGREACADCETGTYSVSVGASSACAACASNSNSTLGGLICTCNAGWSGPDGGECVLCVAGTYKDVQGSVCSLCAPGKFSMETGKSDSDCDACPPGEYSGEGSMSCTFCPEGSQFMPDTRECANDLVRIEGSMTVSVDATTFEMYRSRFVAGIADAARVHSSRVEILSVNGARRLLRRLLQTQGPSTNTGSVAVDFRITVAASSVQNTSALLTQTRLSTWTVDNGVPVPIINSIVVTCGMGLTPSSTPSECVPCDDGYYKRLPGDAACLQCEPGTFSNSFEFNRTTHCLPCPSNSSSANASTTCSCVRGFSGPDGGACSQCVAGKHKNASGSGACTDCENGTYSALPGAVTCLLCPTRSDAPVASTEQRACTCNAGSTGADGGPCEWCAAGTYKPLTGAAACTACESGHYSATVGAAGGSTCLACPSASDAPTASTAQSNCSCNAGSTGSNGGPCALCAAGTYKPEPGDAVCVECTSGKYSAVEGASVRADCQRCPANSDAPAASTNATDCTCNAGFWATNGGCTPCAAGTYSTGVAACRPCPSDSHSPASSASAADCRCNAGYALAGGNCSSCGTGMYSSAGSECAYCSAGKYSDVLAASMCTACSASHFQLEPGAAKCAPCKAGEVSIPDRTACRVPAVCPGWSDTMVDATAAELMIPTDIMSDKARIASFYVLELFVAHYARQPEGRSPPTCIAMYDRVVARMQSNADSSHAHALVPRFDVTVGLVLLCVLWRVRAPAE